MAAPKHAFLSYVHEDAEAADAVQKALERIGVTVWRDKNSLGPGDLWKKKIRDAIQGEALAFVALISSNSINKERSYQRPELLFAAEEYQLHPPEAHWLFVARLDDCPIPHLDLGGGRTLTELQWVDLFGDDREPALVQLTVAIHDLFSTAGPGSPINDVVIARPDGDGRQSGTSIKALLRDPSGDIQLEDQVEELAIQAAEALDDRERFPLDPSAFSTAAEGGALASRMLDDFETVLEPLRECLTLAGTWARPANDRTWARAMERIAVPCLSPEPVGQVSTLLKGLRQYPLLWLSYAVTIAAVERENFSPSRSATLDARAEVDGQTGPLLAFLNPQFVFQPEWFGTVLAAASDGQHSIDDAFAREVELGRIPRRRTPATDRIHDRLRHRFRHEFPIKARYTEAFDRASILMDAVEMDLRAQNGVHRYLPAQPGFGSYTWRYQHAIAPLESVIAGELSPSSPFLAAGYFGGDFERASAAISALVDRVAAVRAQHF